MGWWEGGGGAKLVITLNIINIDSYFLVLFMRVISNFVHTCSYLSK